MKVGVAGTLVTSLSVSEDGAAGAAAARVVPVAGSPFEHAVTKAVTVGRCRLTV